MMAASVFVPTVLLLVFSGVLSPIAARQLSQAGTSVKLCIQSPESQSFVNNCTAAFAVANTAAVDFSCVLGGSLEACTSMIEAGTATLTLLGAADQFNAHADLGMMPLVSEVYADVTAGASYYAVAIVNKAMCDANPSMTLADLAGTRSCHTGYRKTSGWSVPVGYMTSTGAMPLVNTRADVAADAETVAAFFSDTCAVGTSGDGPANGGQPWDQMCSACGSDCSDTDIYADYPGALRGLMADACDVAFTKQTIPLEYAKDGSTPETWSTVDKADLRLVCPSGGCDTVDNFESCTLGRVPARSLVGLGDLFGSQLGVAIQTALSNAAGDEAFITETKKYIFSEDTATIQSQSLPFDQFFSAETMAALESKNSLEALSPGGGGAPAPTPEADNEVKICIPSLEDQSFLNSCTQAMAEANTADVSFRCTLGGSLEACTALINAGAADLVLMGATDQFTANRADGMMPLVSEVYADVAAGASYFAIAVVEKAMCDANPSMTLADLAGTRSCHTGYRKTSGWSVPVGYMTNTRVMPVVNSDSNVAADAETVVAFFSQTCAVGTSGDGPAAGGEGWDELCTACGQKTGCSSTDIYADYPGALRGVMEEACDVGFTKHSIPLEYAMDGSAPETWSTVDKADLRLVCPSGGCAAVDDYASCSLGRVPARSLVGTGDLFGSTRGTAIQTALATAGQRPAFVEKARQYVFSEDTTSLQSQSQDFDSFFSSETVSALEGKASLEGMTPGGGSGTQDDGSVKICIPEEVDSSFLTQCTSAMAAANTNAVKFSCVSGGSTERCISMVATNSAQLVLLGATDQFTAYNNDGLTPLVQEIYSDAQAGASYYAIAAVKAEMCDANPSMTLADLAGTRSCHTGYRKTSGWSVPVGFMTQIGAMPIVNSRTDVAADAETVAAFFSDTCAVGTSGDGPANGGQPWDQMCSACGNDCSSTDIYADYQGALRGLMADSCDVAFTKQSIPLEYAKDGSTPETWSTVNKADMRLVCPAGGCASVDDFERCSLGRVPARALVSTIETHSSTKGKSIQDALTAAARTAAFLDTARQFVFSEDTTDLQAQTGSFNAVFNNEILSALEGKAALEALVPGQGVTPMSQDVNICIPSVETATWMNQCTRAMAAANTDSLSFVCVAGGSTDACTAMVEAGAAHLVLLGATDQFTAYNSDGLMPLVQEIYADVVAGASYFSIAVVEKAMCDADPSMTLADLAGKRSCHTGYRKTSGWSVPVGYMVNKGMIPVVNSNDAVAVDAQSVASFFSQTCAVGTSGDGPAAGGEPWDKLCTACGGDCSSTDIYADYPGALRGVMEEACDVGFTKHSIPLEYAMDGSAPETWSTVNKADLRLVCPSGGCATVDNYASCSLGRIPARALVGTGEMHSSSMGQDIQDALTTAAANPSFLAAANQFVFSSETTGLQAQTGSFDSVFNGEVRSALEGKASLEGETLRASSGGSSGVSSGAAAGIAIGCAVGGALLAAAAMYFVMKRKARYAPHVDEGARVMTSGGSDLNKPYI